jgi:hypothetical protein
MTFRVIAENGNTRDVETLSDAEDVAADMEGLGMTCRIEQVDESEPPETDGGEVQSASDPTTPDAELANVSDKDLAEDPLSVMPSHFVDTIQGVPTINRKGYAVLAEHFGISVTAEPVTLPGETDFEYAEFQAVATTHDGQEYSGFGSAHVDRMDGDDPYLLAELAETRAMKRATAWATGVGMTAFSEMSNSL